MEGQDYLLAVAVVLTLLVLLQLWRWAGTVGQKYEFTDGDKKDTMMIFKEPTTGKVYIGKDNNVSRGFELSGLKLDNTKTFVAKGQPGVVSMNVLSGKLTVTIGTDVIPLTEVAA